MFQDITELGKHDKLRIGTQGCTKKAVLGNMM